MPLNHNKKMLRFSYIDCRLLCLAAARYKQSEKRNQRITMKFLLHKK